MSAPVCAGVTFRMPEPSRMPEPFRVPEPSPMAHPSHMSPSSHTPERPHHRGHRTAPKRRPVIGLLAVAAIGLVGCGGGGASHTASHAAATTTLASASQSTTAGATTAKASAARRRRPHRPKAATTTAATTTATATVTATATTIAPTAVTPSYRGPSPEGCLTAAGLNRARAATEPGVWEANAGLSALSNRLATVFLAGPLKSPRAAERYAQSLTVVEIAASGGAWVASAALPSHLDRQVAQAAACMGRPGATRSKA